LSVLFKRRIFRGVDRERKITKSLRRNQVDGVVDREERGRGQIEKPKGAVLVAGR